MASSKSTFPLLGSIKGPKQRQDKSTQGLEHDRRCEKTGSQNQSALFPNSNSLLGTHLRRVPARGPQKQIRWEREWHTIACRTWSKLELEISFTTGKNIAVQLGLWCGIHRIRRLVRMGPSTLLRCRIVGFIHFRWRNRDEGFERERSRYFTSVRKGNKFNYMIKYSLFFRIEQEWLL